MKGLIQINCECTLESIMIHLSRIDNDNDDNDNDKGSDNNTTNNYYNI